MMKPRLAFVLFALVGCESFATVEGVVQLQGKPVEHARVTLDDRMTLTTDEGRFVFDSVEPGIKQLSAALNLRENGFVAIHEKMHVAEAPVNVTLDLPDPIVLSLVETSAATATIQWTPSTSPDFLEYKVSSYPTDKLLQETESLVHQERNIDDRSYVDTGLLLNGDYFYRVSVFDDIGLIAKSNVVGVHIPLWDTNVFSKYYKLEMKSQFVGPAEVGGICWDGSALWVACSIATGDNSDPRKVWIARHDVTTWTSSSQIAWNDGYARPAGIGCDAQGIWVSHVATDATFLQRRDAITGDVTKTFPVEQSYHDLDFDGQNLLAASPWNHIDVLNPETGAINRTYETPFVDSTVSGMAQRDGEIWVASWLHNEIAVLDANDGSLIGLVNTGISMEDWNAHDLFMTFVGDDIAIVMNSHINLYQIITE